MAENQMNETQAQDEFENPPAGPIGLHRGQRSWIARLVPFLITLLVAAALATGTWLWMSGKGREIFSGASSSTSQTSSSSSSSKNSDSNSDSSKSTDASTDSSDSASTNSSTNTDSTGTSSDTSSDTSAESTDSSDSAAAATAASTVDTSKSVTIYNGLTTRISGFAAGKAATLKTAGYTSVTAKNPTGTKPSANVVWYKTVADEATAKDVASKLGIASVAQSSSIATDVAVMYISQ